jgi:hypothetical protein
MPEDSSRKKWFTRSNLMKLFLIGICLALLFKQDRFDKAKESVEEMIASGPVRVMTILPDNTVISRQELREYNKLLYGKIILSTTIVEDPTVIKTLLIGMIPDKNSMSPDCFSPRHIVQSVSNPDNYLVICFECRQLQSSRGGHMSLNVNDGINEEAFNELVKNRGMITEADLIEIEESKEDNEVEELIPES